MRNKNIFKEAEETALPSSDEEAEDSALQDDDNTSPGAEQSFQLKYKVADESAVTLRQDYILSLAHDEATGTHIAAGLSNGSVQLYEITAERGLNSTGCLDAPAAVDANEINICGVRFLDETPHCLLVGSTNGLVRLFDLRTKSEQARFQAGDNDTNAIGGGGSGPPKSISCFDRNANGRVLCAGTDQYQNNVYLLFFDVRERKQLGGYFESHEDDVTAVRFHAQNPDLLCTGSTDGLINVFDIKQDNEDDALMATINTESSVHKLNWHKNVYDKDIISCITHTNDFKTYECEEGDLVAQFERAQITTAAMRKNPANCNLVDAHNLDDGGIFLLAGTNFKKGEIMRSLQLQNKQLLPLADFDGNHQIVRESLYNTKTNAIITAGESGIVSLWTAATAQSTEQQPSSTKLKSKTKLKSNKKTPY